MTTPSRAFAPQDFAQLIAVALIWGVNNMFAKIAVDAFPAMVTVVLRFALVLVALAIWLKPPPKGKLKLFALMLFFIGPFHFGVQYVGLKLADTLSPMVIAMQLWAPCSVVFAALLLKESVSPLRWAGVGLAFLGAASMNFDPVVMAQWGALLLVGVASASYGLGTVLVRKLGAGLDPWATQAWTALAVVPTLSIASLTFETGQWEAMQTAPWYAWACIAFGGIVSSIVASAFMFKLVQKYEVSRTTPYLLMTPVVTFALASVFMGDVITPQIAIGGALTIGGVALVALAERRLAA